MKEIMVNGKTLEQCLNELKAFKGTLKTKDMGGKKDQKYYPIEEYYRALDTVLGCNYSVEFSEMQYVKLQSDQDMLVVKCRITLLDDKNLPVLTREGYGGEGFTYQNSNGREPNPDNVPYNAQANAFKGAAKMFDVFGTYANKAGKSGGSAGSQAGTRTAAKSGTETKPVETKPAEAKPADINASFHTSSPFYEEGEDKEGRKIWKVQATLDSDGSDAALIFYPNQYGKDEEKFNRLLAAAEAGSQWLRLTVKPCAEREGVKQFVFKDYLTAAA